LAKYKVLKVFTDKETNEKYVKNSEIELTVKRAEEVEAKVGNSFLERIVVPEKVKKAK